MYRPPGGVYGYAVPRVPRRVLSLADQDRPAARRGPERRPGQADSDEAGPAEHLVEGHLLPLRAKEATGHALPERRQLHHHPGETTLWYRK